MNKYFKFIVIKTIILVMEQKMYKCSDCIYSTKRPYDLKRHVKAIHKDSQSKEIFYLGENQPTNTLYSVNEDVYDIIGVVKEQKSRDAKDKVPFQV